MRLLRGGPWVQSALWLLRRAYRAWKNLTSAERARMAELLGRSRGRRSNLSVTERAELGALFRKARARKASRWRRRR